MISDDGESVLSPGDCAGFPAGRPNGHQLINRSSEPVVYLEVGTRSQNDIVTFPDDDLLGTKTDGAYNFTRKDGNPV